MESPHALCFPFPVVGHINPMIQLAYSLSASCGFKISFLTTEYRLSQLLKSTDVGHHPISFLAIPDGISDEDREGPMAPLKTFEAVGKMAATGVFERVMEDLKKKGTPVSCIISDTFVSWTQFAADKEGIPRVALWTSCAASYLIHHHVPSLVAQGLLPVKANSGHADPMAFSEMLGVAEPLPAESLPSILLTDDISAMEFKSLVRLFENDRRCKYVLINSYEALESTQFQLLRAAGVQALGVGPLLPPSLISASQSSSEPSSQAERPGMLQEDQTCLQWLHSKPPSSVLYVSFGSQASLPQADMHELALGLESSKQSFLWVIRGSDRNSLASSGLLPEGFLERTEGQGMIISWAPQLKVLAHPAVGGFLTHAGWNSTLESICFGVPLIAMPNDFGEQKTTAWFIEHVWGIGLQLELSKETSRVSRDVVATAVCAVMGGPQSKAFLDKAAQLREAAKLAIARGGSSYKDLELFALGLTPKQEKQLPPSCNQTPSVGVKIASTSNGTAL